MFRFKKNLNNNIDNNDIKGIEFNINTEEFPIIEYILNSIIIHKFINFDLYKSLINFLLFSKDIDSASSENINNDNINENKNKIIVESINYACEEFKSKEIIGNLIKSIEDNTTDLTQKLYYFILLLLIIEVSPKLKIINSLNELTSNIINTHKNQYKEKLTIDDFMLFILFLYTIIITSVILDGMIIINTEDFYNNKVDKILESVKNYFIRLKKDKNKNVNDNLIDNIISVINEVEDRIYLTDVSSFDKLLNEYYRCKKNFYQLIEKYK